MELKLTNLLENIDLFLNRTEFEGFKEFKILSKQKSTEEFIDEVLKNFNKLRGVFDYEDSIFDNICFYIESNKQAIFDKIIYKTKSEFEDIKNLFDFNKPYKVDENKNRLMISINTLKENSTYLIQKNYHMVEDLGNYYVNIISKIETSSTSLADPLKAYGTTSARKVTTKTIKTIEYVKNLSDAGKQILKHQSKIMKVIYK